jgi:dTDP-4-dehydrorhamnose 3,5-epimerase
MAFRFHPLAIPEVVRVEPTVHRDERGWFLESYKRSDFEKAGIPHEFRQDNHSASLPAGVLRGLHYQLPPRAQGKLVRVLAGAVFDVAADVRPGSPTYGKWVAQNLSAADHGMLWVPPGFAHGFCTLAPGSEVAYKTTAEYSAQDDRGIRWDDPRLAIAWPVDRPLLSPKDRAAPLLSEAEPELRERLR